jgi:hypothetical protein
MLFVTVQTPFCGGGFVAAQPDTRRKGTPRPVENLPQASTSRAVPSQNRQTRKPFSAADIFAGRRTLRMA